MTHTKQKLVLLAAAANVFIASGLSIAPAIAKVDPDNIAVMEEHIDDHPYVISRILVKARPEQVWQIVTDYNGAPNVFATMKSCRVLSDKGNTKVIHCQVKPTGFITCLEYDLEVHEQPHKQVEWHRIAGDFKAVDGFWKLESVDYGRSTMVTYGTYVNGGIFMPQAFVRHQSHVDLPPAMAALRDRAETTMHIASHGIHNNNQ